jgi:hypothetical protein
MQRTPAVQVLAVDLHKGQCQGEPITRRRTHMNLLPPAPPVRANYLCSCIQPPPDPRAIPLVSFCLHPPGARPAATPLPLRPAVPPQPLRAPR